GYLLDFFLENSPEEQKLWIAEHQSEIKRPLNTPSAPTMRITDWIRSLRLRRCWKSSGRNEYSSSLPTPSSITKGCREVTEEDERQAEILCQSFRERWKEEEK